MPFINVLSSPSSDDVREELFKIKEKEKFVDQLKDFFEFISSVFKFLSNHSTGVKILFLLLFFVSIAVIVFFIIKAVWPYFSIKDGNNKKDNSEELTFSGRSEKLRDYKQLFRESEQFYENKNYNAAITSLHNANYDYLAKQGIINYDKPYTNNEVKRKIAKTQGIKRSFHITSCFAERVVFNDEKMNDSDTLKAITLFKEDILQKKRNA